MNTRLLTLLWCLACWPLSAVEDTGTRPHDPPLTQQDAKHMVFDQQNLLAWCIVSFDAQQRTAAQRADMLHTLGFTALAYDKGKQSDEEFAANLHELRRHDIAITATYLHLPDWPSTAEEAQQNAKLQHELALLRAHDLQVPVWCEYLGQGTEEYTDEQDRYDAAAAKLTLTAELLQAQGCRMCLYNHGGWAGKPQTMLAIAKRLQHLDVGIVYNFHHGHEHLADLPAVFPDLLPYLFCVNLNGMNPDGPKILSLGQGSEDKRLLQMILNAGYQGPLGIIGHRRQMDARVALSESLDGLQTLLGQLKQE